MRVTILHDLVERGARADETDVLVQRDAVIAALRALGHHVEALGCGLDLQALRDELEQHRPDLVFNLVESIARSGRLIHVVPALLDTLGMRYTGARTDAIYLTSHKRLGKRWLAALELPVARDWQTGEPWPAELGRGTRWIVKSVWEHGSVGMDHDSVVTAGDAATLAAALRARRTAVGGEALAEQFVDGREFNLALLTDRDGVQVLPPAEIEFVDWHDDTPRIVDWRAKWDAQSPEYHNTPRRFDFPAADAPLLRELEQLARAAWTAFRLRGWARVDFRVHPERGPIVLEVNTNPCLSPDAGFAAALARAGLDLTAAIERIVADAMGAP
ncbi:MAG: D-alanine--D-alanine ligase [Planctomycetes bacterium]|nr:D-alanine--D-alanine ligase [Planctomycetota bacterium]